MRDRAPVTVVIAGILVCVAWLAVYAVTGRLSDDGLHAYAARELLHGRRLYLDFQYHQAPLLPVVLSRWFALTSVSMLSAKRFAAAVAALVMVLTLAAAHRAGADRRGLAALLLVAALSPSLMLHLGYVQSQGLATLLALAACLAMMSGGPPAGPGDYKGRPYRNRGPVALLAAGLLLGLAAGARVSFIALALPLWLVARPLGLRAMLAALFGFAAGLAGVWLPFALGGGLGDALYLPIGPGGGGVTSHFVALYHAAGGPFGWLTQRLAGWPNQLICYAPIWLWLAAVAWRRRLRRGQPADLLLIAAIVLTVVHGLLPSRINHSYLIVAMPFWLAWLAAQPLPRPATRTGRAGLGILLALAAAVAVSRGIGRIDRSGGATVQHELIAVGALLARAVEPDETIFTFAVEFAVGADRDVCQGMAPGYFCYYPNMDRATAERLGVLNPELALALVESGEPRALLLHEGAFLPLERTDVAWPDRQLFLDAAARLYDPVQRWPAVGETRSRLTLWLRREEPASPRAN